MLNPPAFFRGLLGAVLAGAGVVLAQTGAPRIPANSLPLESTNANTPFVGFGAVAAQRSLPGAPAVLTVKQTSPTAIVRWDSFDIGANAVVRFQQPSATSTILNRIEGGLLAGQTTIDGRLSSNGQLYLLNPNGIVFGKTAQVDVGSMVASSLSIDEERFKNGLLSPSRNPDLLQNLFTDPASALRPGDVVVEGSREGGVLQQAALTAQKNGFLLLAAPTVRNDGVLRAPDGQVVLAGGTRVYLSAPTDASMRGLRVEIGDQELQTLAEAAQQTAASATNGPLGTIAVGRGNVTLAGMLVNQSGAISANTSLTQNGSVWLRARSATKAGDADPNPTGPAGNVVLGPGSSIRITPTLDDTASAPKTTAFNPSSVEISAANVDIQERAEILAPGGNVSVVARQDLTARPSFATESSITVAAGSRIDVAGVMVSRPMESNLVKIELRGTELADNPALRDSPLRGQAVVIDARKGTAIANVAAALELVETGVGERTAQGGNVSFLAEGKVDLKAGAQVNVAGGAIQYRDGYVTTSKLRVGEQLVDIGSARAGTPYDGVVTPLPGLANFEPGYTEGRSAGSIQIAAPQIGLGASLGAQFTLGERQRMVGTPSRPTGGSLSLGATAAGASGPGIAQDLALGAGLDQSQSDESTLVVDTAVLKQGGFSRLNFTSLGEIRIERPVSLAPGSNMRLTAVGSNNTGDIETGRGNVLIKADVSIPSGSFTASARNAISVDPGVKLDVAGRWVNDSFQTNPVRNSAGALVGEIAIAGGSIDLAANRVLVGDGASVDVSAGAWLDAFGKLTKGSSGALSLRATKLATSLSPEFDNELLLGRGLQLLGYGWDFSANRAGGALRLTGRNVVIDSKLPELLSGESERSVAQDLYLTPSFFQNGGFSAYSIAANANLSLPPGVQVSPRTSSFVVRQDAARIGSGSIHRAAEPSLLALNGLAGTRPATNVSLSANSLTAGPDEIIPAADELSASVLKVGKLDIGTNAAIVADPGATVSLAAGRQLIVDGRIEAPGGKINLSLVTESPAGSAAAPYSPVRGIWLDEHARLLAPGSTARLSEVGGFTQGALLDGGQISIGRPESSGLGSVVGYVVAAPGAVLDVSGVDAGVLRFQSGSTALPRARVGTSAGSITALAREGLWWQAKVLGAPGLASAQGGVLSFALNREGAEDADGYPSAQLDLTIGPSAERNFSLLPGANLDLLAGRGWLDTAAFAGAGFDRLNLKSDSSISLAAGTRLLAGASIVLDTPILRSSSSGAPVQIEAPWVQLGNRDDLTQTRAQDRVDLDNPQAGADGRLEILANTVDIVGQSAIDGFASTRVSAVEGIRLSGLPTFTPTSTDQTTRDQIALQGGLLSTGSLELRAAQIYPTTLSDFSIRLSQLPGAGVFRVLPPLEGAPINAPVFSAMGSLSMTASSIEQGGRISAPNGTLRFEASESIQFLPGSVTSVVGSATLPFGSVANGQDWNYSFGNAGTVRLTVNPDRMADLYERSLTEKAIQIHAPTVRLDKGATLALEGGGQLLASEFVPGPLGSSDFLLAPNRFAILPGVQTSVAPIDWDAGLEGGQSAGLRAGDSVWLSGYGGLATGYYTLLPARYALLPGAYAISALPASANFSARSNRLEADGSITLAGQKVAIARPDGGLLASAAVRPVVSEPMAFSLVANSLVRQRSEYRLYDANGFFAAQADAINLSNVILPADGGHLSIDVTAGLQLSGKVRLNGVERRASVAAGALSPRSGMADIAAPELMIRANADQFTGPADPASATVELAANELTAMNAESLLIGGVRRVEGNKTSLDVRALQITVDNGGGAPLAAAELVLAATERIQVNDRADLRAQTAPNRPTQLMQVAGSGETANGALIRLSGAPTSDLAVLRESATGSTGTLELARGALVRAAGAAALDATANFNLASPIELADGGVLSLAAPRISLGSTIPIDVQDIRLGAAELAAFTKLSAVTLKSDSTIDLYGSVVLGSASLGRLTLAANGLLNAGSASQASIEDARLFAGTITLSGINGSVAPELSDLQTRGSLLLSASKNLVLSGGTFSILGYQSTALQSGQRLSLAGGSQLRVGADLEIAAGRIVTTAGGLAAISGQGDMALRTPTTAGSNTDTELQGGGLLALQANGSLLVDTTIQVPAGQITLSGDKGVRIAGGRLDVSSFTRNFGSTQMTAPAGTITLESAAGKVEIGATAVLDVSARGADAGSVRLIAPDATASIDGRLVGNATALGSADLRGGADLRQGSFALDVGNLADGGFVALNDKLKSSGFTESLDLRVRSGEVRLPVGSSIRAHEVRLAADGGPILVDGSIDASGDRGGKIELYAPRIRIGSSAMLDARATAVDQEGGRILLSASQADAAVGAAGILVQGGLVLESGAQLQVGGAVGGAGGRVLLRAPQTADGDDVALQARGAKIFGSRETIVEAVRVYRLDGDSTISEAEDSPSNLDASLNGRMFADADRLMQNQDAVIARVDLPGMRLQPGIEVQTSGDLVVSVNESAEIASQRGWDLSRWRFGGEPIALTLRAAGRLSVLGSVSDGFVYPEDEGAAMPGWQLGTGASASYRMAAGADLMAANPLAVRPGSADLVLDFARPVMVDELGEPNNSDLPVALLRTGTGQIQLAAGRDLIFGRAFAPSPGTPQFDIRLGATVYTAGEAVVPEIAGAPSADFINESYGFAQIPALFGTGGGSISLLAGRDVVGTPTPQLVNNWLFRQGDENSTAWWIRPDYFNQGVATFGGGDLSVTALAGSVRNLGASVASTGWFGLKETDSAGDKPVLHTLGGGVLSVVAGQNIEGGTFYVQRGGANLRAGGTLKAGEPNVLDRLTNPEDPEALPEYKATRPVLALGDAAVKVVAGGDLELEAAFNPTLTLQSTANVLSNGTTTFLSYGPSSSLRLMSSGGSVALNNDGALLDQMAAGVGPSFELSPESGIDYPWLFRVVPSQLTLAALGGNVEVRRSVTLAPANTSQLQLLAEQSVFLKNGLNEAYGTVLADISSTRLPSIETPRPLTDLDFKLLRGVVEGVLGHDPAQPLADAAPVRVVARQGDVQGDIQGVASLISNKPIEVQAGRDIVDFGFRVQHRLATDVSILRAGRDLVDTTVPTIDGNPVDHVVTGPGRIAVVAGRNVDLGNSGGLVSRGNLDNPYLVEGGARIEASAGIPLGAAGSATSTAEKSSGEANRTLFANLVSFAREPGLAEFDAAIAKVFPSLAVAGNISLTGSQVRTEQGGSIDLFAPAGSVDVSLIRVPDFIAARPAASLGIFTIRGGDIRALVKDDFAVNTGRVFSLRGGDISLVSQYGNIDAGRGSKTASSAPPPLLTTDQNGNTKIDISASIAGSGIATLRTTPDQPASNVYPVAPRGIFDAGDAGVRSTGSVEVVAQTVLNAGNISAAGGVSGAPSLVPAVAVAAPPGAAAASEGSGKSVAAAGSENRRLLNLGVEVLGFGVPCGDAQTNPERSVPCAAEPTQSEPTQSEPSAEDEKKRRRVRTQS